MSQSLPDANASTPRLPPRGALRRILEAIGVQNVSLLIALALLVAFIGGQNSNFFYSSNIATLGTTVAIVGILSVVQTVVMLLGGLDISVSSQAGLTSVVSAMVFMATQSAFAGIAAALVLGFYDAFGIAEVFALGIAFGWLRVWSGSTLLTIGLHVAVNTIATVPGWLPGS